MMIDGLTKTTVNDAILEYQNSIYNWARLLFIAAFIGKMKRPMIFFLFYIFCTYTNQRFNFLYIRATS